MKKRARVTIFIVAGCIILLLFLLGIKSLFNENVSNYELDDDYKSNTNQSVMTDDTITASSEEDIIEPTDSQVDTIEIEGGISQDGQQDEEEALGVIESGDDSQVSDRSADSSEDSEEQEIVESAALEDQEVEEVKDEALAQDTVEEEDTGSAGITDITGITEDTQDEAVEDSEVNQGDSDEGTEEEAVAYTGNEHIDSAINEHRDEIDSGDLANGLSIFDKIDLSIVLGYYDDGLTDNEKEELKAYLHSLLTDSEYADAVAIFNKYGYMLE